MGIQQSQGWIHYMYHKPGTIGLAQATARKYHS